MSQRSTLNAQRTQQNHSVILLTGCAGFIGSNLLDRLLSDGHKVIGVDDFNDFYSPVQKRKNIEHNLANPNFTLIEGDICNSDWHQRISSLTHQLIVDCIIHLAACAGVRASIDQPLLYEKVNVGGTLALLELTKKLKVNHFILGSSSSVYGNNSSVPFKETAPCDQPISPYAATKRSAELLTYSHCSLYQTPTTILRFFTVFGPRNRPDMAAYKFTDAIAKGKPIEVFGQETSRDYTFIDDIVNGIIAAVKLPRPKFDIINLGNSSPVPLNEFITAIESLVGKKAKIKNVPLPPGDVKTTYADISKAKKLLSWQPQTKLRDGLAKLWDWYQSQNATIDH